MVSPTVIEALETLLEARLKLKGLDSCSFLDFLASIGSPGTYPSSDSLLSRQPLASLHAEVVLELPAVASN